MASPRIGWPLSTWLISSACQATVAVPALELPSSTRAITIARQGPDGGEIWAAPWPGSNFGFGGEGELEVLAWSCSLEHLGLTEGRQGLREEPAAMDLLPDPATRIRGSIADGVVERWTPGADRPTLDVWRRLEVANDNRCLAGQARFRPRPVLGRETRGRPTFAIRIDEERILVGARSRDGDPGTVGFLIHHSGAFEVLDLGRTFKTAAFYSDEGELWMLDQEARLTRGPLEGPWSLVTTSSIVLGLPGYASLDGARGGAPFELFANTRHDGKRRLARFDGQRWDLLGVLEHGELFIPSVAWIGPGLAIGLGAGQVNNQTIRYDRGEVKFDLLPGSPAGASSIRYLPNLGPVVGRDDGELDVFRDQRWVLLGGVRDTVYARSLAPVADGLIFSAGTEINFLEYRYGQYYPALGTCPLQELTDYAAGIMTAFGNGSVLAVTLSDFEAPVEPVILELQVPPHACSAVEP